MCKGQSIFFIFQSECKGTMFGIDVVGFGWAWRVLVGNVRKNKRFMVISILIYKRDLFLFCLTSFIKGKHIVRHIPFVEPIRNRIVAPCPIRFIIGTTQKWLFIRVCRCLDYEVSIFTTTAFQNCHYASSAVVGYKAANFRFVHT